MKKHNLKEGKDKSLPMEDLKENSHGIRNYKRKNENSVLDSNLKSLNNIIKENLLKVKKLKDKNVLTESQIIIERNIIKKRFNSINENKLVITKSQKKKFFNEVINEMFYLNYNGYNENLINEGLLEFLGGIFGDSGNKILQVFKEYITEWLIYLLQTILNSQ